MKKQVFIYASFIFLFVLCLIVPAAAQTATATDTPAPDTGAATSGAISALFDLLLAFGVGVPAWVKVVVPPVIIWLVRKIDKRRLDKKTAKQIRAVIGTPVSTGAMHPEHTGGLWDIIHKLEGKKAPKDVTPGTK